MSESIYSLARSDNHAAQRAVKEYVTDRRPGLGLFVGLIIVVAIAILLGIGLKSISTQPIEYLILATLEVAPVTISILLICRIIWGCQSGAYADREFAKPLIEMDVNLRNELVRNQIHLVDAYNCSDQYLTDAQRRHKNDHITLRDLL